MYKRKLIVLWKFVLVKFYINRDMYSVKIDLSVFNCGVLKFLTIILDLLISLYNLISFFCDVHSYKFVIIIS